ncbi:MAG TPA: prolipoprotein diacylglyceryl transferase family protein [Rhizomicrobium sp.]|nr:prolipoprotein diacylglyceryl transferase family protein [Rhizomicrobium sp.]
MQVHAIFDLLAWASAFLLARFIAQRGWLKNAAAQRNFRSDPWYFASLSLGALGGAILFGSLNMTFAGMWTLGHSIAGAIAGGIVTVELYKLARGIRGSTGLVFVAPLALGIAVGRLGCFFAGLPDYTYGVPTHLPWGVDFGDGILRHPVQLYESAAMLGFLVVYLRGIAKGSALFLRQGFYLFTGFYALQRFAWEFLKPYPDVLGPFNIFHLICMVLFGYSIFMMRWNHELRAAV